MKYGRMFCTTIPPKETTWPIVSIYRMKNNKVILLDIYSQSQFSHKIEDGKMSCERIVYANKKIFQSKNFSQKLDLYKLQ